MLFEIVGILRVGQTMSLSFPCLVYKVLVLYVSREKSRSISVFYGVFSPIVVLSQSVMVRSRLTPSRLSINES